MPRFSKYSGAGNDFLIARAEEVGMADASRLARRMCPRATGVGVDGLILARSMSDDLVRVRFFNPDGSEFGTCGNGSRCVAHYAFARGMVPEPDFRLITDDGEIQAHVEGDQVSLDFELDPALVRSFEVDVEGSACEAWLVSMGTPHLVVPVDDIELEDFARCGAALRNHAELGEPGANVDLVELDEAGRAWIRTFERGVEGETMACGSGSMAAALVLNELGRTGLELELETRSGARLRIDLLDEGVIRLTGPAWHLFEGVYPD